MAQPQFPFQYPGMYSPGQLAFNNNPELSQMFSMFAGPLMGNMFGPNTFVPHMMPGQALADQYTMRNYQNQTRAATFNLANNQNEDVATRLLGMRSMFTKDAATDLNRQQARSMAGFINNPLAKSFLGMAIGPDNLEAMLHGRRGDITSIGAAVNNMGYFRRDPGGGDRMDAESLEDLASGVFSHLYEPQGDVKKLSRRAREGDRGAARQLQTAAGQEDSVIVSDADVASRLQKMDDAKNRVDTLYKKYVAGGTATDTATQAKELAKFNRAVESSGVLTGNEKTIGQLEKGAFDKPTDDMRGFMAGQVSQVMQNLSERGIIGPGLGGASAQDRVKAIAGTNVDSATLGRLARDAVEREVTNPTHKDHDKFRNMTDQERDEYLNTNSATRQEEMKKVRTEAQKAVRGDRGAMSPEDILKMGGSEALVGNVDASRTASTLKDYTGALDAVRDIFGDNGNPNAPMPALLAALDQLTHGAMGTMNPAQASNTLRQMQTLARETGTGMQQMAAISHAAGAMGQQLGLAPSITMQNVANTMGITKSMMDRGAFSGNAFGSYTKDQAQMKATQELQQGDASINAKSMAAIARMYAENPDDFEGGENGFVAAAVRAYKDPRSGGRFEHGGQQFDLGKMFGERGVGAAYDIISRGKGNVEQFRAFVNDPLTQYYQQAGFGRLTQKSETVRELSSAVTTPTVRAAMKDSTLFAGMSEKDQKLIQSDIGKEITAMALDSANMNPDDRVKFMKNGLQARMEKFFKDKGYGPNEAKTAAVEVAKQMGGAINGRGGDTTLISTMLGNLGTLSQLIYGENFVQKGQMQGNDNAANSQKEMAKAAARVNVHAQTLGAHQSGPLARIADYFLDIGQRGENFNAGDFFKEMAAVGVDRSMAEKFAGSAGAGLGALAQRRAAISFTQERLNELTENAQKGDKDAQKELRERAGLNADDVFVTEKTIDDQVAARIKSLSDKELEDAYIAAGDVSGGVRGGTDSVAMREALGRSAQFRGKVAQDYTSEKSAGGTRHVTYDMAKQLATKDLFTALKGKKGELEDINLVEKAVYNGGDAAALKVGMDASFRLFKDQASGKEDTLRKLIQSDDEGDGDKLLKILGFENREDYERGKAVNPKVKSDKQRFAETQIALRDARINEVGKITGPDGAKQQVQEAKIDAQTVVIKAGRVEGAGATTGSPASAPDMSAINKEMNEIETRKRGILYKDFATEADEKRWHELNKIKHETAVAQKEQKTNPKDPVAPKDDRPLVLPDGTRAGITPDAAARAQTVKSVEEKAQEASPNSRAGITPDAAAAAGKTPPQTEKSDSWQPDPKQQDPLLLPSPDFKPVPNIIKPSKPFNPSDTAGKSVEEKAQEASPNSRAGITLDAAAAAGETTETPAAAVPAAARASLVPTQLPSDQFRSANIMPVLRSTTQEDSDGIIPLVRMTPNQLQEGSPGSGNGKDDKITVIEGTLAVNGMHEAVLRILGQRSIQTPSGGIPVVTDPPAPPVMAAGQRRGATRNT